MPLSAFAWGGRDAPEYAVFGVGCAEVEVDALTGERRVVRMDMMQEAGRSINPAIDIGQVRISCAVSDSG